MIQSRHKLYLMLTDYLKNLESIFMNIIKHCKMIQPPALIASERALFHDHFKYTITHAVHKFFATQIHSNFPRQRLLISALNQHYYIVYRQHSMHSATQIPQRLSMGFRSGEFAGHSITCTSFCKNHFHVEFAT